MGKKKLHPKLWRALSGTCATVLAFFVGGNSVACAYNVWIDRALSTPEQQMITESGESPVYFESEYASVDELLAAKSALLEEVSEEGSVLLKNEAGSLPISNGAKVTLLGEAAFNQIFGGTIGSSVKEAGKQKVISLEEALTGKGFSVNPATKEFYSSNPSQGSMSSFMFGPKYDGLQDAVIGEIPAATMVSAGIATGEGSNAALTSDTIGEYSDAAIVVFKRDSSEAAEYNINSAQTEDGDSYDSPLDLTTYEKQIIDVACNSFDKVIVILNTDVAMGIDYLKDNEKVDAVLWAGIPGAEGFNGVADILNGSANPSGKLTDTYAVHPASAPANANMGMFTWANASVNGGSQDTNPDNGKSDWYVVENEGIYVGYKYYETRYADALAGDEQALNNANATEYVKGYSDYDAAAAWNYNDQVSYPFGYGLSYTTFEQKLDDVAINTEEGTGKATVTVTNTGSVDGKNAVELYVQAPYTAGGVEKAAIQLIDYEKVEVKAGETTTVELNFDLEYFASYDKSKGQWTLDDGNYYFAVGNGAHEALNSVLLAQGAAAETLSISTAEEVASAEKAKEVAISGLESYLAVVNEDVENRFEQADYKTYDETFEYVTRSDWSKGWKTIGTQDGTGEGAVSYPEDQMAGLSGNVYEITQNEKTEDMNFDWESGAGLRATEFIGVGLDETITKDGKEYSYDDLVNCMSLYEAAYILENEYQNFDAIPSISLGECAGADGPTGFAYDQIPGFAYSWVAEESNEPTYVAKDDENAETSMAALNSPVVLASTFSKELVERVGQMVGEDSLWADISTVVAPAMNLHRSAYNARNHEYYSEDPMVTSYTAAAYCTGAEGKGLMTMAKHFAFNHQEINRSGVATFFDEQAGRENELRGFQMIMQENITSSIMTAFNRVGFEFAGGCPELLMGVARTEWNYEGYMTSDMVNGAMYMNWRDAFACTSGTLGTNAYESTKLGASTSKENLELIAQDAYLQQQIHDAVKYIVYKEVNSNFMNGMDETTAFVNVTPWWKTALIAAIIVSFLLTLFTTFMFVKTNIAYEAQRKEGK